MLRIDLCQKVQECGCSARASATLFLFLWLGRDTDFIRPGRPGCRWVRPHVRLAWVLEYLADALPGGGACLPVERLYICSECLGLVLGHLPVGEVGFVPDEDEDDLLVLVGVREPRVPVTDGVQGGWVGEIEDDQSDLRIPVVLGRQAAVGLLSGRVPDQEVDVRLSKLDFRIAEAGRDRRAGLGWN
jgi:hypothetical protein